MKVVLPHWVWADKYKLHDKDFLPINYWQVGNDNIALFGTNWYIDGEHAWVWYDPDGIYYDPNSFPTLLTARMSMLEELAKDGDGTAAMVLLAMRKNQA